MKSNTTTPKSNAPKSNAPKSRTGFQILSLMFFAALGGLYPAAAQSSKAPTVPAQQSNTLSLPVMLQSILQNHSDIRTAQANLNKAHALQTATLADPSALALTKKNAESSVKTAIAQLQAARLGVLQNTITAYTGLLEIEQTQEIQSLQLKADERALAVAKAKLSMGNATTLDVQNAQAALIGSRQTLTDTDAQLTLAKAKLAALFGQPVSNVTRLPTPVKVNVSREKLSQDTRGLPAMVEAQEAVSQAELTVKLADNDWTPARTLADAKTNLANAERSLEAVSTNTAQQLAAAYQATEAAYDALLTAHNREAIALKTYQQESAKLKGGLISVLELEQAQLGLARAQQARLQAHHRYVQSLAALSVASGRNVTGF